MNTNMPQSTASPEGRHGRPSCSRTRRKRRAAVLQGKSLSGQLCPSLSKPSWSTRAQTMRCQSIEHNMPTEEQPQIPRIWTGTWVCLWEPQRGRREMTTATHCFASRLFGRVGRCGSQNQTKPNQIAEPMCKSVNLVGVHVVTSVRSFLYVVRHNVVPQITQSSADSLATRKVLHAVDTGNV